VYSTSFYARAANRSSWPVGYGDDSESKSGARTARSFPALAFASVRVGARASNSTGNGADFEYARRSPVDGTGTLPKNANSTDAETGGPPEKRGRFVFLTDETTGWTNVSF